jgi:hypothetical protein
MNDNPEPPDRRPKPAWRGAAFAAAFGAITASIAYVVSRGNLVAMLAVMVAIGILFRLYAYILIRRGGTERPPWWRWL